MKETERIPAESAADLVAYADDVRQRTRDALASFWFPLILFGTLTLLSAPIAWQYGGATVGIFWAVAGPVGGVITGIYYARREKNLGLSISSLPFLGVVAVLFLGAFGLPALTTGPLQEVISGIWVGLCYIAFGRITRSWPVALVGAASVGAILLVLALNPPHITSWAAIVAGTLFLGTGIWLKAREKPT